MFDEKFYANFDKPFPRVNTESEKWDDRAAFGNPEALPMWVADMDFETVPQVLDGLKARVEHGAFGYSIQTERDKNALINWMDRRHNLKVSSDEILFSPGVVDSIYHSLKALLKPNSRVIIQPPVYGPFFSMPEKAGMQVIENPLLHTADGWRMNFEGLEELLKQGAEALILCSPHNPVGRVWTKDELATLAALCKRYGTRIIADEIHADFELDDNKHTCILNVPGAENAVQLVSATKTFNLAALRHSSIICKDEDARGKIAERLVEAMADVNLFGRLATRLAYESSDDWLDTLLVYIADNRNAFESALLKGGRLVPCHSQGTYLMWVDCRTLKLNDDDLRDLFIQKAGVLPSEGRFFGAAGSGFIRINLATQRANVLLAAEKIEKAIKEI